MTDTTGAFDHIPRWDVAPFAVKTSNVMVSAWISNCHLSTNRRLKILEQLIKFGVSVHNYGKCRLKGESPIAEPYHDLVWEASSPNFSQLRAKNLTVANALPIPQDNLYHGGVSLFYYAAENTNCEYYHTEKPWLALSSGAVPIYLGSSLTAREFFPENSMIYFSDFDSVVSLASHLLYLASNETAYNAYLAWRKRPLPPHLQSKIALGLTARKPERWCHICEFLHKNYNNSSRGFRAETQERCT